MPEAVGAGVMAEEDAPVVETEELVEKMELEVAEPELMIAEGEAWFAIGAALELIVGAEAVG